MRVLIVEDEPYMAEAIRDGLRLEAIAADIAGDGDTALELLSVNAYDIAVLDRDIPGPSGDEVARRIVASGGGMPILMLTAADRLDDKASGFELGADTATYSLRERPLNAGTSGVLFGMGLRLLPLPSQSPASEPWLCVAAKHADRRAGAVANVQPRRAARSHGARPPLTTPVSS